MKLNHLSEKRAFDLTAENILSHEAKGFSEAQKIKTLANEFESVFLEILMKSMRDTVHKTDLVNGGHAEEVYQSFLDQEYSKSMAKQRFTGIADSIEKQLLERIKSIATASQQKNFLNGLNQKN